MLVLDTDHMSALEWASGADYERLNSRLEALQDAEVCTTIISYEEQSRGWLAYVARARKIAQQIEAFRRLRRHLDAYRRIGVLDFDEPAAVQFQGILRLRLRIGTRDQQIAAIVLSRGAKLLTRNIDDFSQIPGLDFEDWTS